jgi:hypothetical protein
MQVSSSGRRPSLAGSADEGTEMRVVVVHHDVDIADQEADSLRRAGFEVQQCSGPVSNRCPVLRGERCALAEGADVLVYDVWATGETDGGRALVAGLRDMYPDVPIVLTAPGLELDWVETEGPHRVVPLVGVPTAARLADAIRRATSAAVPATLPSVTAQKGASL